MADRLTVSGDSVLTEDEQSGDVTAHVDALTDATDGGAWETLKLLGYEEGDFVPLKTYSTRSTAIISTTSSTYQQGFEVNEFIVNSEDFPAQMHYRVKYRGRPYSGTLYSRLYNLTDDEPVPGSELSVSNSTERVNYANGVEQYTPPTPELVSIEAQFRNTDGTTDVELHIAQVELGCIL